MALPATAGSRMEARAGRDTAAGATGPDRKGLWVIPKGPIPRDTDSSHTGALPGPVVGICRIDPEPIPGRHRAPNHPAHSRLPPRTNQALRPRARGESFKPQPFRRPLLCPPGRGSRCPPSASLPLHPPPSSHLLSSQPLPLAQRHHERGSERCKRPRKPRRRRRPIPCGPSGKSRARRPQRRPTTGYWRR